MKKYVADEEMQFDIRHNEKNVIDLDAPSEEDDDGAGVNSDNSEIEARPGSNLEMTSNMTTNLTSTGLLNIHKNTPSLTTNTELLKDTSTFNEESALDRSTTINKNAGVRLPPINSNTNKITPTDDEPAGKGM